MHVLPNKSPCTPYIICHMVTIRNNIYVLNKEKPILDQVINLLVLYVYSVYSLWWGTTISKQCLLNLFTYSPINNANRTHFLPMRLPSLTLTSPNSWGINWNVNTVSFIIIITCLCWSCWHWLLINIATYVHVSFSFN